MGELKELDGMHANNGLLCDFTTRWRIDGDYIRCGICDRPQLTSYADNDFPHADFCREKDSPTMERRPWRTYVELLRPLLTHPQPVTPAEPAFVSTGCEGNPTGYWINKPVTPAGGEVEPETGPLPRPLWEHEKEWYTLCERAPHADSIKISGQLAEAIIEAVCRAPIKITPADLNAEYARGRADGWEAHPPVADAALQEAARYRWLRDDASRGQVDVFLDRRGTRLAADRVCDHGIELTDAALNQRGGGHG